MTFDVRQWIYDVMTDENKDAIFDRIKTVRNDWKYGFDKDISVIISKFVVD